MTDCPACPEPVELHDGDAAKACLAQVAVMVEPGEDMGSAVRRVLWPSLYP